MAEKITFPSPPLKSICVVIAPSYTSLVVCMNTLCPYVCCAAAVCKVPTTVFTPLELAAMGLTEEKATAVYGEGSVQVCGMDPNPALPVHAHFRQ